MREDGWEKEFPVAITLCDTDGIITDMNDRSIKTFRNDGGKALIGSNVLDCHPEPSRTQLLEMLENGSTNVYTIEKNGKKKLIYQAPWKRDGVYAGLVEISIDLPDQMPHFVRKP